MGSVVRCPFPDSMSVDSESRPPSAKIPIGPRYHAIRKTAIAGFYQKIDLLRLLSVVLILCMLASSSLLLLCRTCIPKQLLSSLPENLNRTLCPHVILFTQARHGSSWLLDSVERCRFSRTEQVEPGIFGKRVYLDTELWHVYDESKSGRLHSLSPDEVIEYVQRNCSVKIFPPALKSKGHLIRQLMRAGRGLVPFLILTRDLKDAYLSYKEAKRSGNWARVRRQNQLGQVKKNHMRLHSKAKNETEYHEFAQWTSAFFRDIRSLLAEEQVPFDEYDYDVVKEQRWLFVKGFNCYIRSCNFR